MSPDPSSDVAQALGFVGKTTEVKVKGEEKRKGKADSESVVKAQHGRKANKARAAKGAAKVYRDYAPARYRNHPLSRLVNWWADQRFKPKGTEVRGKDGKVAKPADDSAVAVELGEAWTAAGYYGFGLPPYDDADKGDGHPYVVALERTGRFALPKVAPYVDAIRAKLRQQMGGK